MKETDISNSSNTYFIVTYDLINAKDGDYNLIHENAHKLGFSKVSLHSYVDLPSTTLIKLGSDATSLESVQKEFMKIIIHLELSLGKFLITKTSNWMAIGSST